MASRIKGITVEIGGDTSGLEKSLCRSEQFHKEDPEPASGCE